VFASAVVDGEPEAGSDQILFVCILTVARISLVKGERYIRMSQTSMEAQEQDSDVTPQ
jgi:hypothetical protein